MTEAVILLRKSMDWFLYDNGLRHEGFKEYLFIRCFQINLKKTLPVKSYKSIKFTLNHINVLHYSKNNYFRTARKALL